MIHKAIPLWIVFIAFSFTTLFAQKKQLPFSISEKRKLHPKDYKEKREGWYPTIFPLLGSDPNAGIAFGTAAFLFNNKDRTDPFFAYTPFRSKYSLVAVRTTKNVALFMAIYESPFFLDSKWGVKLKALSSTNPRATYFGNDSKSLRSLTYRRRSQADAEKVTNAKLIDYEENLAYRRAGKTTNILRPYETDIMYNRYILKRQMAALTFSRSIWRGVFNFVGGFLFSRVGIETFDDHVFSVPDPVFGGSAVPILNSPVPTISGKTKVTEDSEAEEIVGIQGGFVNTFRLALVYDTRDLTTNPSDGVFAELTYEQSEPLLGSDFFFHRNFLQIRSYLLFFPKWLQKSILASRIGISKTNGESPFFESQRIWGTQRQIIALGGNYTLRGYVINRFVAKVIGFASFELRHRLLTWRYEKNFLGFYLTPIYDIGKVWDTVREVDFTNYKHSYGLGLRVVINHAMVLSLDYSQSRESRQFFMSFNHAF
ncbi:MAG: DUF5982 domain-containing protein [Spirochaetota bacterium]